MARMFPSRFPDGAPGSERKVYNALSKLDGDWTVFHSVAWQRMRGNRQGDGEADFVVAHPAKGLFIIEVKGGNITLENGQWSTTNRKTKKTTKISPFSQTTASKHCLGDYLKEKVTSLHGKLDMGHAVWFPDVAVGEQLSPESPREIILDHSHLADPVQAIGRLAGHWNGATKLDEQQFAQVRKALAPTVTIQRKLAQDVSDTMDELIELTEQQLRVLSLLRRQRRAMIRGGAGTGKTLLAAERVRQLAADGHKVLFLCFNAPLGEYLAAGMASEAGVEASHFHKFARKVIDDAGMLPGGTWDQAVWDEQFAELLPEAASKLGVEFDAIVIDEGQDFHPQWWTALQFLLADPDDGILYVFADDQQDVYRTGWEPPFEGEPFPLDVNCRNTVPIGQRVGAVFNREELTLGADGPAPTFVEVPSFAQAAKQVGNALNKLVVDGGLKPDSVTVLSNRKDLVEGLRGQQVDGHLLTRSGGGGITVETVQRFKGLENDAVILALDGDRTQDDLAALAYVGLSRARAVLYVIGTAAIKKAINWDATAARP